MADWQNLSVAIVGAGSIGCYVGGMLASSGHRIRFVGRERLRSLIETDGLQIKSLEGINHGVAANDIDFKTTPEAVAGASHVLVCVKSMDTATTAAEIASHLAPGAVIVSLQNGLDNPQALKTALPGHPVHAGMVAFNVIQSDGATFSAATEGGIYLDKSPDVVPLAEALTGAGIDTRLHDDMSAVQWSKLLMNLNNALNALSGKPLAEQLRDRRWRRRLAACVREGLTVMRAAGVAPVRIGKVHPRIIPMVLSLPDFLFERVASQMLKVDPRARSSMADDLALGRAPEIDYLNGAIVDHGSRLGVATPANTAVCAAISQLFAGEITAPVNPDEPGLSRPAQD